MHRTFSQSSFSSLITSAAPFQIIDASRQGVSQISTVSSEKKENWSDSLGVGRGWGGGGGRHSLGLEWGRNRDDYLLGLLLDSKVKQIFQKRKKVKGKMLSVMAMTIEACLCCAVLCGVVWCGVVWCGVVCVCARARACVHACVRAALTTNFLPSSVRADVWVGSGYEPNAACFHVHFLFPSPPPPPHPHPGQRRHTCCCHALHWTNLSRKRSASHHLS